MSDNSEILIVRHLRRAVPRADVLLFTRRKASAVKQIDLRDFFLHYKYSVQLVGNNCLTQGHVRKGLQECLLANCCSVSWLFASYSPNFFRYEDSRKHTRTMMILNQQMEIPKWLVVQPKFMSS